MIQINEKTYTFISQFGSWLLLFFVFLLVVSFGTLLYRAYSNLNVVNEDIELYKKSLEVKVLVTLIVVSIIGSLITIELSVGVGDIEREQEITAVSEFVENKLYEGKEVEVQHMKTTLTDSGRVHEVVVKQEDDTIYNYTIDGEPIVDEYIYERKVITLDKLNKLRIKSQVE